MCLLGYRVMHRYRCMCCETKRITTRLSLRRSVFLVHHQKREEVMTSPRFRRSCIVSHLLIVPMLLFRVVSAPKSFVFPLKNRLRYLPVIVLLLVVMLVRCLFGRQTVFFCCPDESGPNRSFCKNPKPNDG